MRQDVQFPVITPIRNSLNNEKVYRWRSSPVSMHCGCCS